MGLFLTQRTSSIHRFFCGKEAMRLLRLPILSALFMIGGISFVGCDADSIPASKGNSEEPTAQNTAKQAASTVAPKGAGPVENIDADERRQAALLMPSLGTVQREIRLFRAEVRSRFEAEDFAWLEKTARTLRKGEPLFANGSWKIYQFYEGMGDRFGRSEDQFLHDQRRFQNWRETMPESVTAKIAQGHFLTEYAWFARGSGYAHTVSFQGHMVFRQRLGQARLLLMPLQSEFVERQMPYDPFWGAVMLRIALGQGWKPDNYEELLTIIKELSPRYWGYDVSRAYSLLPRWYGSSENDWVDYAGWAADQENGLGDEGYARVVTRMVGFYGSVFRETRADRARTLRGLRILLDKYPDSELIASQAARLAVVGRDREMAKALFERLGDTYIEGAWINPEQFVHFRTWAKTGKW